MKNGLLLLLLLMDCSSKDPVSVYVCNSPNTTRYHYKQDCKGLSNCTYQTIKVTLAEAKKRGKTLCHWEGAKK